MAATKDDRRLEVIGKCLNYMCNQVEIENAIRRYNINISMENFYAGVLNTIWGYHLENCNLFEEKNKEAIDLSDKGAYIAVQVTSTDTPKKIRKTIDKFNERAYYNDYDKLYMYILTGKVTHKTSYDPGHGVEFRILDASDMMAEIERAPLVRQKRLYEYFTEKIPEAVALFEEKTPEHIATCEMLFSRTDMAFWMNPYAADDEQWYEDHYQIALADYLITMENNGLYLLIDPFAKDVAYTLNCHAEEVGVLRQWTEKGEAGTGKVIYFDSEDTASCNKIIREVRKWKDTENAYQLLINFTAGNKSEIFRTAMWTAREIRRKWPSIVPEMLTLVNPYELDFGQENSLHAIDDMAEQLQENFNDMRSRNSFIYKLLHENRCTFASLLKAWINGSDDEKYNLIEFASHSRTAIRMVMAQIALEELESLFFDDNDQLLYRTVKWDEIIFCLVQKKESLDNMGPGFWEKLLQKGSDGCRTFIRSKQPDTREDWNELTCITSRNNYEQYMKSVSHLDAAERLKLLYGCAFAEKERAVIIKDKQRINGYQQMLIRKDIDTEYLFPEFIGGVEQ